MSKRPAIPTIDEVADVTCTMLRQCHNLEPMLHVCRPDRDELVLLADLPDTADGREAAAAAVAATVGVSGPIRAVYLILEAWAVEKTQEEYARGGYVQPRHDPARRDILLIYGWYPDGRPIERRQFAVAKDGDKVTGLTEERAARRSHEAHNTLLDGFVAGYQAARAAKPAREN
jgi:hypothetical protein